jgi:hypothetical protein
VVRVTFGEFWTDNPERFQAGLLSTNHQPNL